MSTLPRGILANDMQSLLGSPQMQGIAMGLLQASGPSPTPISLGQALGQGMQMGNQMQEQARQRQLNELMMELKMKDYERKAKQQQQRDSIFEKMYGGGGQGEMSPSDLATAGAMMGDPSLIELAKFKQQSMKDDPAYISQITQDKATAKNEAEAIESYKSMSSKLPSLIDNIQELSKLANDATYTTTGRVADWLVKETGPITGTQATDGAVARTTYQTMVSNQILPLLRDTFGAQFTEREGARLEATLGDVNLSPQEKQASLEAFINQKIDDVNAKARRLGLEPMQVDVPAMLSPSKVDPKVQQALDAGYSMEEINQFLKGR